MHRLAIACAACPQSMHVDEDSDPMRPLDPLNTSGWVFEGGVCDKNQTLNCWPNWLRGYKMSFMLNSTEHEIYHAHKY